MCVTPPLNPVVIGKIMGAYGVLGWMRVASFTEQQDHFFDYVSHFIIIENKWRLIYLDKWRLLGKRYIAKARGISDRNSAKLLTQCEIVIDKTQLPYLQDGEYYWKDLIGCKVISVQGIYLGSVINIIETAANDVLVVKTYKDNLMRTTDCLIPFLIKKVIKNVDLTSRIVTVDWNINF